MISGNMFTITICIINIYDNKLKNKVHKNRMKKTNSKSKKMISVLKYICSYFYNMKVDVDVQEI